jgi:hypothetical protein
LVGRVVWCWLGVLCGALLGPEGMAVWAGVFWCHRGSGFVLFPLVGWHAVVVVCGLVGL